MMTFFFKWIALVCTQAKITKTSFSVFDFQTAVNSKLHEEEGITNLNLEGGGSNFTPTGYATYPNRRWQHLTCHS